VQGNIFQHCKIMDLVCKKNFTHIGLYTEACNFLMEEGILSLTNQDGSLVGVILSHEFCAWYTIGWEIGVPHMWLGIFFSLVFIWAIRRNRNVVIGYKKNVIYPAKSSCVRDRKIVCVACKNFSIKKNKCEIKRLRKKRKIILVIEPSLSD
jgi:hypothetical protein